MGAGISPAVPWLAIHRIPSVIPDQPTAVFRRGGACPSRLRLSFRVRGLSRRGISPWPLPIRPPMASFRMSRPQSFVGERLAPPAGVCHSERGACPEEESRRGLFQSDLYWLSFRMSRPQSFVGEGLAPPAGVCHSERGAFPDEESRRGLFNPTSNGCHSG